MLCFIEYGREVLKIPPSERGVLYFAIGLSLIVIKVITFFTLFPLSLLSFSLFLKIYYFDIYGSDYKEFLLFSWLQTNWSNWQEVKRRQSSSALSSLHFHSSVFLSQTNSFFMCFAFCLWCPLRLFQQSHSVCVILRFVFFFGVYWTDSSFYRSDFWFSFKRNTRIYYGSQRVSCLYRKCDW